MPASAPAGHPIRSVNVTPLSARTEITGLVRAACLIAACAWVYAGSHSTGTNGGGLLTFQRLMADLPGVEQRMFRELQEGLLEAERARATSAVWPEPAALERDGIPPFARDATAKDAPLEWRRLQRGVTVNYLGIPSVPNALAWLVMIQEPDPGSPPDMAADDEEHHRLPDGTVLHVSVWTHDDGQRVPAELTPLPQARGWTQIVGRIPGSVTVP